MRSSLKIRPILKAEPRAFRSPRIAAYRSIALRARYAIGPKPAYDKQFPKELRTVQSICLLLKMCSIRPRIMTLTGLSCTKRFFYDIQHFTPPTSIDRLRHSLIHSRHCRINHPRALSLEYQWIFVNKWHNQLETLQKKWCNMPITTVDTQSSTHQTHLDRASYNSSYITSSFFRISVSISSGKASA